MDVDHSVWSNIGQRKDFARFTEIKNALDLSPERLTRALRRLEKDGMIFRTVGFRKDRPINEYLAIDGNDPKFRARIVDNNGWLFVIFEWLDTDGLPSRSISSNLGEMAEYTKTRNGQLVVGWPPWGRALQEAGKLKYEEFGRSSEKRLN